MTKTLELIKSIRNTLENNHCKSVQVMTGRKDDMFCIKIINIPNKKYKEKVVNILENNYCESISQVKETVTTLIYQVASYEQVMIEHRKDQKYISLLAKIDEYVKNNYIGKEA